MPDNRGGIIQIVRVYPGNQVTAGAGKALVNRIRLPAILFGNPACQPIGIFLNDSHGTIRGTAIHDVIFQVGVILVENGLDGLLQKASLVEGRGHNGDQRGIGIHHTTSLHESPWSVTVSLLLRCWVRRRPLR